jgi:hypothetical protein
MVVLCRFPENTNQARRIRENVEKYLTEFLAASLGPWSGVRPSRVSPGAAGRSECSCLAVDVLLDYAIFLKKTERQIPVFVLTRVN